MESGADRAEEAREDFDARTCEPEPRALTTSSLLSKDVDEALALAEKWWKERLAVINLNLARELDSMHSDLINEFQRECCFSLEQRRTTAPEDIPCAPPPVPETPDPPARHLRGDKSVRLQEALKSIADSEEPDSPQIPKPSGDDTRAVSAVAPDTLEHPPVQGGAAGRKSIMTQIVPLGQVLDQSSAWALYRSAAPAPVATSQSWPRREILEPLEKFVKGQTFEVFFALVIVVNTIVLAIQVQYAGLNMGYEVGYQGYDRSAEQLWPGAATVLESFDKAFVVLFALELFARIAAYRTRWFYAMWSYVDAAIVGIALGVWMSQEVSGEALEWNPMIFRMVRCLRLTRVARVGKLMRVVRIMRTHFFISSLKLLVASLQASCKTLFWSLCVVVIIQSMAAMTMAYAVEYYVTDTSAPVEVRREVFGYFGTFWRSFVTMFEIIFANWAPSCRLLLDNVSEKFGVFFLVYRCAIGFAVVSVIQAVFIQQTMKSAQLDDDIIMQDKEREQRLYRKRLTKAFEMLDESGDGLISRSELDAILTQTSVQKMLANMEIIVSDLDVLFTMLDSGTGMISSEDFITGLQSMKGGPKAFDVVKILYTIKRLDGKIDSIAKGVGQRVSFRGNLQ